MCAHVSDDQGFMWPLTPASAGFGDGLLSTSPELAVCQAPGKAASSTQQSARAMDQAFRPAPPALAPPLEAAAASTGSGPAAGTALSPSGPAKAARGTLRSADAPLPEKEIPYPAEPARAGLPSGAPFHVRSPPAAPAVAPLTPASLGKAEPLTILSRNATHPLLHINTLYEAREEEEGGPRLPQDVGDLIAIPAPQQILIATFDEPRTVVSTVEF
ncbi:PREDICTED: pannexin-2 [Mandrillus leucophaeus]|uniref:pannexin-2 n=1 Tax=Mandrillus leucophaeus TaxID=9568 RepID=UPI0005F3C6AF|nr:PREDICTED: pannexin-2 [Mandrillus leucophaeus]